MAKNMGLILCLLICAVCSGYKTADNENIRFGSPEGKGKLLSKTGYVLLYDSSKRNPVWVSYCLKKENIITKDPKAGAFKPDLSLPVYEMVQRTDYPGAYDKCPMAPVIDMAYSTKTHKEAFLLTNVCAMNPFLKKGEWRKLEDKIRDLAARCGQVWVVAGPVFNDTVKKKFLSSNSKIRLPSGFYKVILYQGKDSSFKAIGFYFDNSKNQPGVSQSMLSIAGIEDKTGLKFFSALPDEVRGILVKNAIDPNF